MSGVDVLAPPLNADTRRVVDTIRQLLPSLYAGELTLTAGLTTVVVNPNVGPSSFVQITPTNSAAAALSPYVSSKGDGQFTVTHATAAGTETFDYRID